MSTPAPPRLITGRELARLLEAAGIITLDLNCVERVVIVAEPDSLVQVHVQSFGDERLVDVAAMLAGKDS